jgi:hypothetical protein
MSWTPVTFGRRHKGKTLPVILLTDPDWFFWAWEEGAFQSRRELLPEAKILHAKATSIKVPQRGTEHLQVQCKFYSEGHTSVGFDLVATSEPLHHGSTPTLRDDFIDLSIPRREKGYDKLGYRLFLRSLKFHLFGNESKPMTRKLCEDFFDEENNFHRNR